MIDPSGAIAPGLDASARTRARRASNGAAVAVPAPPAPSSASARSVTASRESTFRRMLAVADGFAITLTMFIAILGLGNDRLTWATLAIPPLFVLVCKAMGLYDRDEHLLHKTTLDELPKLFVIATLSALLLFLSNGLLVDGELDRRQITTAWILLLILIVALRSVARALARQATAPERCLFVGDAGSAEEFREKLATSHTVNAELVGWVPARNGDDPDDHEGGVPLSERLRLLIGQREVHRVVLAPGPGSREDVLDSIRRIKGHGVKVSVLPDVARVVNSSVELDRLNGITLLGVRRFEMTNSSHVIKRGFDLVGSALGLVVLSPLLLVTAIAIKLDSPGPVLFRQRRAGRHGEPFEMLKFRSMVVDAEDRKPELVHLNEADGLFKIADDPRITRVGRWIRPLNLDELPQLINVLVGDMSLVGPRPLVLEEDRRIEGWHRRRLDLRPGITGPWQILGSARISVREMVRLDYQYVADWSLWNDIRILLLTVGHIVSRRGQ